MGSMSLKELLDMQQANQDKRLAGLDTMRDLVRLQAEVLEEMYYLT